MGRKIPARKHMGVRDPIKQKEQQLALIKDKINDPPEKRDFQKVSHSLARFIKLKEEAKNSGKNSKKGKLKRQNVGKEDKPENYKKDKNKGQEARNDKEFTNLKQRPNESDYKFMQRVNRVTQESVEEAKFEAKYGVEVVRNKETGAIKIKKRPRNEIDERIKQNMENHKRVKKGQKPVQAVVLAPEEKRKLVKAMLAEKKEKKLKENAPKIEEFKRDEFKFGEVVHAPPQLVTPRLAQKAETVPRPGRKSLLLHSVIEQNSSNKSTDNSNAPDVAKQTKTIQKDGKIGTLKGKRKDLSMAMRHMIDTEQTNVVKLYKEMKKNQRLENAKKA